MNKSTLCVGTDFKDALVLREPRDDDRDAFDIAARVQVGHWSLFWENQILCPAKLTCTASKLVADLIIHPMARARGHERGKMTVM